MSTAIRRTPRRIISRPLRTYQVWYMSRGNLLLTPVRKRYTKLGYSVALLPDSPKTKWTTASFQPYTPCGNRVFPLLPRIPPTRRKPLYLLRAPKRLYMQDYYD